MVKTKDLARGRFEERLKSLRTGVARGLPGGVMIDRAPLSEVEIQGRLADALALFQKVRDAEAVVQTARGQLHQALPDVHHFAVGLGKALAAYFGHTSAELQEFGIGTGERRPLTAEQRAIAHFKSLATRKKRRTMGRRQRLALTDSQPTVVILDPSQDTSGNASAPKPGATEHPPD
jgi:hypothetical protein